MKNHPNKVVFSFYFSSVYVAKQSLFIQGHRVGFLYIHLHFRTLDITLLPQNTLTIIHQTLLS
jgi:hypothetical protein